MYSQLKTSDYKKAFGLSEEYKVDGLLAWGTWKTAEYHERMLAALSELGHAYKKGKIKFDTTFLDNIVEIESEDKRLWLVVEYGTAKLSEYVDLACRFGSKKNIFLGTCGGLKPGIKERDMIIPSYSYATESSAKMYDKSNADNIYMPDEKLSTLVKNALNSEWNLFEGPIITCQAMLAETLEDVQSWSAEGYYGVEMETATFFSVSNHFKVPSTALIQVADNLIEEQTVLSEEYAKSSKLRYDQRDEMNQIALKLLLDIK